MRPHDLGKLLVEIQRYVCMCVCVYVYVCVCVIGPWHAATRPWRAVVGWLGGIIVCVGTCVHDPVCGWYGRIYVQVRGMRPHHLSELWLGDLAVCVYACMCMRVCVCVCVIGWMGEDAGRWHAATPPWQAVVGQMYMLVHGTCVHVYVRVHVYVSLCIGVCKYVCACVCMQVCVSVYACFCARVYPCICVCAD